MPKKINTYRNYGNGILRDHIFAIVLLAEKLPHRLVARMFDVDVRSITRLLQDFRRMNKENSRDKVV